MNKDVLLKKIKIEDYIWIINLVIVFFALYSNRLEENYINYNDLSSEKKYKTINIVILIVFFFIYGYLAYTRFSVLHNLNKNTSKKELIIDENNLFASILILTSTFIYLVDEILSENKIDENTSIL